jgi:DNA polymerase-3 subunit epsilon
VSEGRHTSLVRTAAGLLASGPRHTLDIARGVLGLTGHDGAAAAAVFQLLGTDPRFRVDAQGRWSLDPGIAPYGKPLGEVRFAVVDVETTGRGPWLGNRIIEIAIVEARAGRIVDEYATLVNPERGVPAAITALTGITTPMVAGAPYFEHVAEEVRRRLEGRVFVAHNAAFDWTFVSSELVHATGDAPDVPKLCTVRMCRRLVPGLRHRNLDVLGRHFGIENHARHRAHGDALATARIFLRLLDEAAGRGIDDLSTLEWYLRTRRRRRRLDAGQCSLDLPGHPMPGRTHGRVR